MKTIFNVYEDTGGGITLTVWNHNIELLFINDGFEYNHEELFDCIIALQETDTDCSDWENNRIDDYMELRENILHESTQLIADQTNFYWDRMGKNGYEALKYFERGRHYNSAYYVLDFFDNYDNRGFVVGLFDTIDKANFQCSLWHAATDGECELKIVQRRMLGDQVNLNKFVY